jgi:hypothetical protein
MHCGTCYSIAQRSKQTVCQSRPLDRNRAANQGCDSVNKAEPHSPIPIPVVRASCGRMVRRPLKVQRFNKITTHPLHFLTTTSTSHSSKLSGNHYNHSKLHPLHSHRGQYINTKHQDTPRSTIKMVSLFLKASLAAAPSLTYPLNTGDRKPLHLQRCQRKHMRARQHQRILVLTLRSSRSTSTWTSAAALSPSTSGLTPTAALAQNAR